jgi:hypothetical protein
MILKINYIRKRLLGIIPYPYYHPFFEIHYNRKIIRRGYYALTKILWPFSLILPVPGEIRNEPKDYGYSIVVSRNKNKIRKVVELLKSKKYNWKIYLAIFRNGFHWRNSILEEAGIKHPRGDWFFRVT